MVAWGIVMTFMGFVHNYSGLLAARWFLGLAEAGLYLSQYLHSLTSDFREYNSICRAGIGGENLVFARRSSSRLPLCQVVSVAYLPLQLQT